jgi:hypothetical protein
MKSGKWHDLLSTLEGDSRLGVVNTNAAPAALLEPRGDGEQVSMIAGV